MNKDESDEEDVDNIATGWHPGPQHSGSLQDVSRRRMCHYYNHNYNNAVVNCPTFGSSAHLSAPDCSCLHSSHSPIIASIIVNERVTSHEWRPREGEGLGLESPAEEPSEAKLRGADGQWKIPPLVSRVQTVSREVDCARRTAHLGGFEYNGTRSVGCYMQSRPLASRDAMSRSICGGIVYPMPIELMPLAYPGSIPAVVQPQDQRCERRLRATDDRFAVAPRHVSQIHGSQRERARRGQKVGDMYGFQADFGNDVSSVHRGSHPFCARSLEPRWG